MMLAERREKPVVPAAKDLGVGGAAPRRWMRVFREAKGMHPFTEQERTRDEELSRLRKENKALRRANEILKKAAVVFARGDP
ncbi:MAG: IS3 family transposase, partial [Treponema sp.]|nr:IS3 family transposase [Treponema sp.]